MTHEEKEKLRNILYNKKCIADYRDEDPFVGIYFNDLIDLLENYIEERSTDKSGPKFHKGDWITDGHLTCKVLGFVNKSYELHLYNDDYCHFETDVQSVDKHYHLWTVNDAEDGDVLVNGANIFIFHFLNGTRLMGYCHVNTDDGIFYDDIGKNECFYLIDAAVYPATKEQRDLLLQKMKEARWELNNKKRFVKKI